MNAIVDGNVVQVPEGPMPELPMGGAGVFETLLWQRSELVFVAPHWARFEVGCRWHGFLPPISAVDFERNARLLTAQKRIERGVVRLAAWRTSPALVTWRIDVGPPRPHMARPDFSVTWGPVVPAASADRAFKHLNRAAWLEALRSARRVGFDEALLTDADGRLVEGCVSNVFVVLGTTLQTPPLEHGPLPGVMRAEIIAFARRAGWDVKEQATTQPDVETASEIWLTNSLIGIRPVRQLAGRALHDGRPMLNRFAEAWQKEFGWSPVAIAAVAST